MISLSLMALTLMAAPMAQAQEEILAPAAAPAEATTGPSWNVVSRSSATVFMLDVNAITQSDGVSRVMLARVPSSGDASDQTHSLTEMFFRCSARQSKTGLEIYIGADGSEEERIENDYEFEPIVRDSLDDYVKGVVCDGQRTAVTYNSIGAFIAAGRPQPR